MKNEAKLVKLVRPTTGNGVHSRETLSPDRARQLLGSCKNFRPMSKSHATKILAALRNDRELLVKDGTPIRITTDGLLKDGQHRCWAIQELGASVDAVIQVVGDDWWGDRGKARSEADYVRNELGEQPRHNKFVAIAKMIANLSRRDSGAFRASSGDNVAETACDWNAEIQWSLTEVGEKWNGDPKWMTSGGAATCAAFAIARRTYPMAAASLAARCRSGDVAGPKDPASALRRFVSRVAGPGSDARVSLIVGVTWALRAEVTGKQVGLIRAHTSGDDIVSAANWLFGSEVE